MSKIAIIAGENTSLINFRGDLIKQWLDLGHEVLALAPGDEVKERVQALGARYRSIPLCRTGLNPKKDFQTIRTLEKVFKKEKPDIAFLYTIKPVIYGSLVASLAKTPEIYSMITGLGFVFVGSSIKQRLLQKIAILLYKKALKRNKRVFFQNPDDIIDFKSFGIIQAEDNKVVQIDGSGVHTGKYCPAPIPNGPVSFILIARLLGDKGIREYVEAAREIKGKYPEAQFKLLGPFDENPTAIKKEEIDSWIKAGLIYYLGSTDDVRPYIEGASVYVLPSFYREGTPRTILEAMAMGRPIITTDAPGCRETVQEGVNGFLVPVKNSKALARVMERFIENPELMQEMGHQSRKIAEEKYDVHKVNRVILEAMGLG